jgi:hypothetical protein
VALFEDDGCSFFPDQWAGQSLRACCQIHDDAFATGITLEQFWRANTGLLQCVWQISPFVAVLMFIGVCSPVALAMFLLGRKRTKIHSASGWAVNCLASAGFFFVPSGAD